MFYSLQLLKEISFSLRKSEGFEAVLKELLAFASTLKSKISDV